MLLVNHGASLRLLLQQYCNSISEHTPRTSSHQSCSPITATTHIPAVIHTSVLDVQPSLLHHAQALLFGIMHTTAHDSAPSPPLCCCASSVVGHPDERVVPAHPPSANTHTHTHTKDNELSPTLPPPPTHTHAVVHVACIHATMQPLC